VREFFRPELINRLDEILVFAPLTPAQIRSIVDVQLARLQKHLDEQEIRLELTASAKDRLAKEGYSAEYGARPAEARDPEARAEPARGRDPHRQDPAR
jgi:ATP-dependent Clp protease ATP-binding subunit ClpA